MKRFAWLLTGVAVLMLAVVAPAAKKEEGDKKAKPDRPAKGEKPDHGRGRGGGLTLAAVEKVVDDLSDDQKAALTEEFAECKKAMSTWMKSEDGQKFKELTAKLQEAKKAKNAEEAKKLMAEMRTLSKARQQIMTDTKAAVLEILTEEQKAKWREAIGAKKGGPKKDDDAPKKGGKGGKGGKKNKGEKPAPE